jgi:probable addiction module antidote protein
MKLVDLSESLLVEDLRDPEFSAAYLEDVLKNGSMESFLLAIRNVAVANGGMKKISKSTKLGRESMYKALSKSGNPQFSTLLNILNDVGLRFSVTLIEQQRN